MIVAPQVDGQRVGRGLALAGGINANLLFKWRRDHLRSQLVSCVFHAIADTHFTRSRTAFHGKADTVSR